jgi:hypothetical protein
MWLIDRVYPSDRSPGYFRDKTTRKRPKRIRKKYGSGLVVSFKRERGRSIEQFMKAINSLRACNMTLTPRAQRRLCHLAQRCGHKIHCVTERR